MHPAVKLLLLLPVLAATFLTSNALQLRPTGGEGAAGASCIPHERDALLAFKHGISSDPMDLLASWQKDYGDCCRWRSVRCSNRTGHVLKLQLRNVNVASSNLYSGDVSILLRNTALVGQISHSLLSLNKLVHLDLSMNNLTGSSGRIPNFLGSLVNLRYLNLSGIPFSDRVSPHLGNLSKLKYLDLSLFGFYWGQPYSTDISWLAGLSVLEYLDMSTVNLSTIVDWTHLVNMIPSMKVLRLSSCSLLSANQSLPHINLTNLERLDLSENIFDHPMASSWVWNMTSLQYLYLAGNYMYGKVPDALGMLAKLTVLDLSSNNINGDITEKHFLRLAKLKTLGLYGNSLKIKVSSEWRPPFSLQEAYLAGCQLGPLFPAWLQFQVNLTWVDISSTGLIDKLPDWFTTAFSKVTDLSISHNQIYGTLPNMEYMSLENVHLSSNNFTGQIPSLPRNLVSLDLPFNSLSGNLPSEFGTPELQLLNLFSNHITGCFSGICELQMLSALDLGNNHLEGELPHQCFPDFLEYLLLSNNNFFGDFPPFLQNRMQLQFLDLSGNKFSGTLPQWIGSLVGLWFLHLSQNMFYGNIPTSITNLTHLRHLNLASNSFSGVVPWDLSRLTAMTAKYTDSSDPPLGYSEFESQDYFSAVTKGKELYYDVTIFELGSIDLSCNDLSGEIPVEIARLDGLFNLNLSRNYLSREISDKIGAMKSLESLDLSNNVLSGGIPSSLSDLSALSYLDLSNNNLTGPVPSGQQLDTLFAEYPSMYSGNSGLCGPTLRKICSANNASRQHVHEHGFEPMSFYFGLGLGFTLGLWLVFCILLFKKAWRVAYSCLIDKMYDQMYVLVVVTWKSLARKGSTAKV